MIRFYGELLAPRPTPKLEDHPLSVVRDCLFDIFAATLHMEAVPPSATRHAIVNGTHFSRNSCTYKIKVMTSIKYNVE